jgi:hypothetical protein
MEFNLMLILRGVQALFAIIVLGLTGHGTSFGLTPMHNPLFALQR